MNALRNFVGILGLCAAATAQSVAPPANSRDARANELQSRYMTPVKVELTSKLDTKTATAGQVLTAKTDAAVTLADGTVIPEGTKLTGKVVEVRPVTEQRAGALVTVTFDQAELKGGKMLAVRSMIRGMTTVGAASARTFGRDATPTVGVAGPVMGGPVGGTRTGGVGGPGGIGGGGGGIGGVGTDPGIGSIGGVSGGPDGDIGSAGGMGGMPPTRTGRQTAPSTITPPVVVTGDVPQKTAEGGETVSQAPKPTGVPGVLLVTDPASGVAGTLIEYGKNIHLDSGTVMTLGVIAR